MKGERSNCGLYLLFTLRTEVMVWIGFLTCFAMPCGALRAHAFRIRYDSGRNCRSAWDRLSLHAGLHTPALRKPPVSSISPRGGGGLSYFWKITKKQKKTISSYNPLQNEFGTPPPPYKIHTILWIEVSVARRRRKILGILDVIL